MAAGLKPSLVLESWGPCSLAFALQGLHPRVCCHPALLQLQRTIFGVTFSGSPHHPKAPAVPQHVL